MAVSYKIHSSSALESRLYTLLPILALVYSSVGPDEFFFFEGDVSSCQPRTYFSLLLFSVCRGVSELMEMCSVGL